MTDVTVINIEWEIIPFNFEVIKTKNSKSDYGIYQIYGHHPAYGQNALLYIGQANEQKFGVRLNERWEFIESCAIPKHIRLGRFLKPKNNNEEEAWLQSHWGELISDVETILIKSHAPAFNKKDNTGLFEPGHFNKDILILNWGDRGALLPEVSSVRYSYKYWGYEDYLTNP
jgi:hypothetical protein